MPSGESLEQNAVRTRQALDPRVTYLVTSMMEDVINHGTGATVRARGFTAPAAGKTGTSRDGWFAGYTSNLLAIVWVGFDDNRDLGLSGANAPAPIWAEFMKRAITLPAYRDVQPFEMPEGVMRVTIDPDTLQLATPACPVTREEVYIHGTEPTEFCSLHGGRMASDAPPASWLSRIFGGDKAKAPEPAPPSAVPAGSDTAPAAKKQPRRSSRGISGEPAAARRREQKKPVQAYFWYLWWRQEGRRRAEAGATQDPAAGPLIRRSSRRMRLLRSGLCYNMFTMPPRFFRIGLLAVCAALCATAAARPATFRQSEGASRATPAEAHPGTLLVFPFENDSRMASLDWLGEGLAELTAERLQDRGLSVLSRQERLAALEKMGLPDSARFSHATMVKIAAEADADEVVFGRFVSDGKTVTLEARVLRISPPSLSPAYTQTSSFEDLLRAHARLSWQILCALEQKNCSQQGANTRRIEFFRTAAVAASRRAREFCSRAPRIGRRSAHPRFA